MEKCAELKTYGLNHGSRMAGMKVGDKLIAYIRKEVAFGGTGEVLKPYYIDNEEIFEGGIFPHRVGVELQLVPKSDTVNVWGLVEGLDFAPNKQNWQSAIVGGIKKIPMKDFETIKSALFSMKVSR